MKYKKILLKAAAVVTAVSVVLSGEGAAFSTVYAAGSSPVFGGRAAGAAVSSAVGSADQNTSEKYVGGGVKLTSETACFVDI